MFCRNCGNEIKEGTKFCDNCGSPVENSVNENYSDKDSSMANENSSTVEVNQEQQPVAMNGNNEKNADAMKQIDKFGKFYGIILMILSFVDVQTEPAFFTIVFSIIIISGCMFCFTRKYKLKGFTIIAMIFSICCLLSGINKAKHYGLFNQSSFMKQKEAMLEEVMDEIENEDMDEEMDDNVYGEISEAEESTEVIAEEPVDDLNAVEVDDKETIEEDTDEVEDETTDGVDPELKAFLDSYEEFMDEYIAFMKKYTAEPENAMAMLSDYTKMLEKSEKFAEKLDEYDEKEMSKADEKYYLEVVNRCNMKMLDAY